MNYNTQQEYHLGLIRVLRETLMRYGKVENACIEEDENETLENEVMENQINEKVSGNFSDSVWRIGKAR